MILERGRNEPCICGSGKKFKKCCIDKQYDDFEDIELRVGPIDLEDLKDGREQPTDEDAGLLEYMFKVIPHTQTFSEEDRKNFHETLLALKSKYTNNPTVVSHLYNFYTLHNQDALAQECLVTMQDRFPTYVYGAVHRAKDALLKKDLADAFAYLKNSDTLKGFDPRRTVFALNEAIVFHMALTEYYIKKEDEFGMRRHYSNLIKLVSMNDGSFEGDYYVKIARKMIEHWDLKRVFKAIAAYYDIPNEQIEGAL